MMCCFFETMFDENVNVWPKSLMKNDFCYGNTLNKENSGFLLRLEKLLKIVVDY